MNLARGFRNLFHQRELEISVGTLDKLMDFAAFGAPSASGSIVSEQGSLGLPAVWACVDLISKAGAVLPGHVYRRLDGVTGRERERADRHYLYPLIHDMANPTLPASEWRRIALTHLLTWGNHYSAIGWKGQYQPASLWPIPPNRVKVSRKSYTGAIEYSILGDSNQWVPIMAEDMLHIRGMGYDGTVGYSPIGKLRNTFGLNAASEESASAMHRNGITSRLAIEAPMEMTTEQRTELSESLAAVYAGLRNQYKALVLPMGLKAVPISINPHDAQFLEQWKYSDSKIYQIYGVPPHMVGDTEKSTSWGTGIEQQTIGFTTFTLMPWMDLIETWLAVKLLPDEQRRYYFVEYDMKGLMRGDSAARSAWYDRMIKNGVYSPNDVLIRENEAPYPGGDVYQRPLNTAFVDREGKTIMLTDAGGKDQGDGKQSDANQSKQQAA